MASLETLVRITPAGIFVEDHNTDGGVVMKEIAAEDLIRSLQSGSVSTPLLPATNLMQTIYYNRQNQGCWSIVVLVQPHQRQIPVYYHGSRFRVTVPIPYTVFGFKVAGNSIQRSYMGSLKFNPTITGSVLEPLSLVEQQNRNAADGTNMSSPLYFFPYGNNYEDLKICWGSVNLPRINGPEDIPALVKLFFDGECNGDLFHVRTERSFEGYMRHLDGVAEYPYRDLYPNNRTLGSLISLVERTERY